ncbi:hypothetical protein [Methylobacterium sp.]|jgi:hypothetical protein|uniref:hypothetical protein n=1 Tax=Methylobacterium sp. TaxID=409 RepID=UPI000C444849|nr:hypothetical protein [Methylobacterium sp.]MBP27869.1 hypothetical protein [Methylobacterium sp.]
METTEQQDVQAETLSGDIRDSFLTIFRDTKDPWAKLPEFDQMAINARVEKLAQDLVRRAVFIALDRGFVHIPVTTGKAVLADGIKIEVSASRIAKNCTILGENPPGPAVLVFADVEDFIGERAPAPVDQDQPGLPIHDEDGVIEEASDLTIDQAEELVAGAETFQGMTVRTGHLPEGERREKLEAAVLAKGGKLYAYPAPNESIRREREKTAGRGSRRAAGNGLPKSEMPAAPHA